MSRVLGNPKVLAAVIIAGIAFIISLAGGALGSAFGLGFLASPIAHIQLPAEPVSSDPILGFTPTNTMITSWITIAVLAVLAYFATRRMNDVPTGLQNLFEAIMEFFLNLAEGIAGRERARRFFPLVMSIFLFILAANWMGILPGYGTIGRIESAEEVIHHAEENAESEADLSEIHLQRFTGDGAIGVATFGSLEDQLTAEEYEEHGVEDGQQAGILVPFLRSANTEINTTLAIAIVAMVMVHYWGFTTLGLAGHAGKFINFKQGPIGFFVGVLEGISEVARLISFTFRLFGNMFAGEVLLIAMAFLLPLIGIIPFLGLELFVGAIQAFIFAMLTLVFGAMATMSHEGPEHH